MTARTTMEQPTSSNTGTSNTEIANTQSANPPNPESYQNAESTVKDGQASSVQTNVGNRARAASVKK